MIIALAAQASAAGRLFVRDFVASGGLVSYGIDRLELVRGAASYVDRILAGANAGRASGAGCRPSTSWSINLKTAKALGLDIPPTLLARADEVIE